MAPPDLGSMAFQPDPTAAEPIYLQLATTVATAIRAGRIPVGAQLPSERLYAQALGVSRTTITAAYQELRAMGLLRGYVGRGAIVIASDPDRLPAESVAWPQLAELGLSGLARNIPDLANLHHSGRGEARAEAGKTRGIQGGGAGKH